MRIIYTLKLKQHWTKISEELHRLVRTNDERPKRL